jgi:hypothetical protein
VFARKFVEAVSMFASTKRFFGSETLIMTQYGAGACPA